MGDVVQFKLREDDRTVDEVLAQLAYDVEFKIAKDKATLTEKKALLACFFGTREELQRLMREMEAHRVRGELTIIRSEP